MRRARAFRRRSARCLRLAAARNAVTAPLRHALVALAAAVAWGAPLHSVAASCAPSFTGLAGRYEPVRGPLHGPGLLLDGGGPDVEAAWRWMQRTLTKGARGSNVLVLTAEPDSAYDAWAMRVAPFSSVRTLTIPPCASRRQIDEAAAAVERADAVFFEGGDQAHYARWKGSALVAAIRRLYHRGGIVGGTSAGLAVQGAVVYDAVAADRLLPDDRDVQSSDATRDPYEPAISFTTQYFSWPALSRTITDTHFARRDRFGRLAAFLARIVSGRMLPGTPVYGLGIDQGSALVVDRRGVAMLLEQNGGGYRTRGAWILRAGAAQRIGPHIPLRSTLLVTHLSREGARYDLVDKRRLGPWYRVTVDGSGLWIYTPRNPYSGP